MSIVIECSQDRKVTRVSQDFRETVGAADEHRTVSRVAAILEMAAGQRHGVRLTAVADKLDAPKSSVHGLLKGLVAVGYLIERDGLYTIGPAIQALFAPAGRPTLARVAEATMIELRTRFDETVMLGVRVGGSIVYLHSIESRQVIKYSAPLHQRRAILPTSMGKVHLADMSPRRLETFLGCHVPDDRRRAALVAELAEVRSTGISFNREETVPGVCAAAAGVRESGRLAGCLSIAGPTNRMLPRIDELGQAVYAAAEALTAQLA